MLTALSQACLCHQTVTSERGAGSVGLDQRPAEGMHGTQQTLGKLLNGQEPPHPGGPHQPHSPPEATGRSALVTKQESSATLLKQTLLSTYSVPGLVGGTGDTAVTKTDAR